MKIGVLTYYGDVNFGTNLQAFSTLQAVRKTFPDADVEIVPFHSFKNDIKPYMHCATPISLYRDWLRFRKFSSFVEKKLGIKKDCIITDPQKGREYIQALGYDRIYVGADTLLELDRLARIGGDGLTAYWLGPKVSASQYMLAASSKHTTYDSLTEMQKKEIQECVPLYKSILVRDTPTARLMSTVVGEQNVKLICDPTFTLDIDYTCVERYLNNRKLDLSNAICIHAWKQDDYFIKPFVEMAKKQGYKVASLRPAKWADLVLNDLGPMEQAGIFRYFKCHITHRFHDTVFCLKNSVPVIAYLPIPHFADEKGESKYSSLLDLFGLTEACLINDKRTIKADELLAMMNKVIRSWNKDSITPVLEGLRCQYYALLKETI